ncbi:NAD(P)/FAD-dependent oxidoreductase [Marinigracilibium pacificum]|uniref:NAD(P)/FAD-dependent oxidoreductase n=1 Tax=Marinigracilibium pacificum TaxID=2729599 RepID=A0A848IZ06_9BACT|nr:FAD/NAD(P)-binding oxidoreductase [Marinigracilibium pacificum]NMM49507.1 NAD(P)/FAD-dependent oxidoreductase [Marinigracilibium pacificum]
MERIIIIGNGISGVTLARHLRKSGSKDEILIISSETKHFFSRTALMYIYMGHMKYEHTKPYEDHFWAKNDIKLLYDHVKHVNIYDKSLKLESGDHVTYDKLVIATGAKPSFFGWPGQNLKGIQGLYSYQDLLNMEESTKNIAKAVIIGGGLIGVEMAEMLRSRNIDVTFLVREDRFWGNVLPMEEAKMIGQHMKTHHIDLRLNTEVAEFISEDGTQLHSVKTSSGEIIETQFAGVTAGVSPNIDFLKNTDIETERGVLIDDQFRTSVPDIYAIGDCAQHRNPPPGRRSVEQVWYTGRIMGETLAQILTGKNVKYNPGPWFNSAKFFDIEYQTYGQVLPEIQNNESRFYWQHPENNIAIHIVFDKDDYSFIGINVFGIRLKHEYFDKMLNKNATVSEVLSNLNDANFDPEFFKRYEEEIISSFNNTFPDLNVSLSAKPWYKKLFA